MEQYISKSALVAEINRRRESNAKERYFGRLVEDNYFLSFINTLKVKDPYEKCIQYDSIEAGIQAHAETYSFNIESELFNQLTKEQQALWRKEIEQACISGGEVGVELARDTRYKENLEVKEVDLEKEIKKYSMELAIKENNGDWLKDITTTAKYFFELGIAVSNKVQKRD